MITLTAPVCQTCGDSRWTFIKDQDGVERGRRCPDCWAAMMSVVDGIPARYASLAWDGWLVRAGNEAFERAVIRWRDVPHDLYLHGPAGSGKTHAACLLALERAKPGTRVAFRDVTTLLRELNRAEFLDHQPERADEMLRLPTAVDLLVLDDVAAEKTSDYSRRTLVLLYNARLDRGRRTIWTSNLDLDQLSAAYGDDRLPSRIAGAAELVPLHASDFRLERQKEWSR